MSQGFDAFADRSGSIVAIVAFVFWGVVQLWSIGVAIFGGAYPWPASILLDTSRGGEWLAALVLFAVGGVLVAATVLVWHVFILWPLSLVDRARDKRP